MTRTLATGLLLFCIAFAMLSCERAPLFFDSPAHVRERNHPGDIFEPPLPEPASAPRPASFPITHA